MISIHLYGFHEHDHTMGIGGTFVLLQLIFIRCTWALAVLMAVDGLLTQRNSYWAIHQSSFFHSLMVLIASPNPFFKSPSFLNPFDLSFLDSLVGQYRGEMATFSSTYAEIVNMLDDGAGYIWMLPSLVWNIAVLNFEYRWCSRRWQVRILLYPFSYLTSKLCAK